MRSITDFLEAFPPDISVAAVIVCAGKGERTGLSYNKILYNIGHKTILETVLDKFEATPVTEVMLVVTPDDAHAIQALVKPYNNVKLCTGGQTRAQSVLNGLKAIKPCDIVVIHDGARPFIKTEIINESIESAIRYGSGVVAVPTVDTIKQVSDSNVIRTLARNGLYNIQTPQTFRYNDIMKAYSAVNVATATVTDDSEVYERAGFSPRIVIGEYDNLKITNHADLYRTMPPNMRIGIGYDVHKLVRGRPLILGGIRVAHSKGLLGHSDADVLTHAIMDSILSAAGLPDIGVLFPDTDPALEGISSMVLLERVVMLARTNGFTINNISAVIIAQEPKMAPYIQDIRSNLSQKMDVHIERINISATTTENLGVIANGNAIASSASCLLTI